MDGKWLVHSKRADFDALAEIFGIDRVVVRTIVNRGADTAEKINRFLNAGLDDLYNHHLLKDADDAAKILAGCIKDGRNIAIAADYDCDGVCSGHILKEGIERCGGTVKIFTPDRHRDGYGINARMVDGIHDTWGDVIVTCDNGISAFEAACRARELKMTYIITDHHAVSGPKLPLADAIVNPSREECPYPYKNLCGAAVAWKLIQILYEISGIDKDASFDMLDLVALATVADVCELKDENRILVKYGLERMRTMPRPGLAALARANGTDIGSVTSQTIGFKLAPCINAAGRLETADAAFKLLDARTRQEAEVCAQYLFDLNRRRKELTSDGEDEALAMLSGREIPNVIMLAMQNCNESVIGIVAGTISRNFNRPTAIFCKNGDFLKGSARSVKGFDIIAALAKCSDILVSFGGHPMAAGMTIRGDDFEALSKRLNDLNTLNKEDMEPTVMIDVPMPIDYITPKLVAELRLLEPTGHGNPEPLFAESGLEIDNLRLVGKNRKFCSFSAKNKRGASLGCIHFGDYDKFLSELEKKFGGTLARNVKEGRTVNGIPAQLTYAPHIEEYNGRRRIQLRVKNYRFMEKQPSSTYMSEK